MNPTSSSPPDPAAAPAPDERRRWIEPAIVQEHALVALIHGDGPPPMGPPFGPLGPLGSSPTP